MTSGCRVPWPMHFPMLVAAVVVAVAVVTPVESFDTEDQLRVEVSGACGKHLSCGECTKETDCFWCAGADICADDRVQSTRAIAFLVDECRDIVRECPAESPSPSPSLSPSRSPISIEPESCPVPCSREFGSCKMRVSATGEAAGYECVCKPYYYGSDCSQRDTCLQWSECGRCVFEDGCGWCEENQRCSSANGDNGPRVGRCPTWTYTPTKNSCRRPLPLANLSAVDPQPPVPGAIATYNFTTITNTSVTTTTVTTTRNTVDDAGRSPPPPSASPAPTPAPSVSPSAPIEDEGCWEDECIEDDGVSSSLDSGSEAIAGEATANATRSQSHVLNAAQVTLGQGRGGGNVTSGGGGRTIGRNTTLEGRRRGSRRAGGRDWRRSRHGGNGTLASPVQEAANMTVGQAEAEEMMAVTRHARARELLTKADEAHAQSQKVLMEAAHATVKAEQVLKGAREDLKTAERALLELSVDDDAYKIAKARAEAAARAVADAQVDVEDAFQVLDEKSALVDEAARNLAIATREEKRALEELKEARAVLAAVKVLKAGGSKADASAAATNALHEKGASSNRYNEFTTTTEATTTTTTTTTKTVLVNATINATLGAAEGTTPQIPTLYPDEEKPESNEVEEELAEDDDTAPSKCQGDTIKCPGGRIKPSPEPVRPPFKGAARHDSLGHFGMGDQGQDMPNYIDHAGPSRMALVEPAEDSETDAFDEVERPEMVEDDWLVLPLPTPPPSVTPSPSPTPFVPNLDPMTVKGVIGSADAGIVNAQLHDGELGEAGCDAAETKRFVGSVLLPGGDLGSDRAAVAGALVLSEYTRRAFGKLEAKALVRAIVAALRAGHVETEMHDVVLGDPVEHDGKLIIEIVALVDAEESDVATAALRPAALASTMAAADLQTGGAVRYARPPAVTPVVVRGPKAESEAAAASNVAGSSTPEGPVSGNRSSTRGVGVHSAAKQSLLSASAAAATAHGESLVISPPESPEHAARVAAAEARYQAQLEEALSNRTRLELEAAVDETDALGNLPKVKAWAFDEAMMDRLKRQLKVKGRSHRLTRAELDDQSLFEDVKGAVFIPRSGIPAVLRAEEAATAASTIGSGADAGHTATIASRPVEEGDGGAALRGMGGGAAAGTQLLPLGGEPLDVGRGVPGEATVGEADADTTNEDVESLPKPYKTVEAVGGEVITTVDEKGDVVDLPVGRSTPFTPQEALAIGPTITAVEAEEVARSVSEERVLAAVGAQRSPMEATPGAVPPVPPSTELAANDAASDGDRALRHNVANPFDTPNNAVYRSKRGVEEEAQLWEQYMNDIQSGHSPMGQHGQQVPAGPYGGVVPDCMYHGTCGACARDERCAWCRETMSCMTEGMADASCGAVYKISGADRVLVPGGLAVHNATKCDKCAAAVDPAQSRDASSGDMNTLCSVCGAIPGCGWCGGAGVCSQGNSHGPLEGGCDAWQYQGLCDGRLHVSRVVPRVRQRDSTYLPEMPEVSIDNVDMPRAESRSIMPDGALKPKDRVPSPPEWVDDSIDPAHPPDDEGDESDPVVKLHRQARSAHGLMAPTAVITGAEKLGLCSGLSLDAQSSTGAFLPMSYQWAVVRSGLPEMEAAEDDVQRFLDTDGARRNGRAWVPRSTLSAYAEAAGLASLQVGEKEASGSGQGVEAHSVPFSLVAVGSDGETSEGVFHNTVVMPLDLPAASIYGAHLVSYPVNEPVVLRSSVRPPECADHATLTPLAFRWTVAPFVALPDRLLRRRDLVVPPGTLTAGVNYNFTFRAYASEELASDGGGVPGVARITVHAVAEWTDVSPHDMTLGLPAIGDGGRVPYLVSEAQNIRLDAGDIIDDVKEGFAILNHPASASPSPSPYAGPDWDRIQAQVAKGKQVMSGGHGIEVVKDDEFHDENAFNIFDDADNSDGNDNAADSQEEEGPLSAKRHSLSLTAAEAHAIAHTATSDVRLSSAASDDGGSPSPYATVANTADRDVGSGSDTSRHNLDGSRRQVEVAVLPKSRFSSGKAQTESSVKHAAAAAHLAHSEVRVGGSDTGATGDAQLEGVSLLEVDAAASWRAPTASSAYATTLAAAPGDEDEDADISNEEYGYTLVWRCRAGCDVPKASGLDGDVEASSSGDEEEGHAPCLVDDGSELLLPQNVNPLVLEGDIMPDGEYLFTATATRGGKTLTRRLCLPIIHDPSLHVVVQSNVQGVVRAGRSNQLRVDVSAARSDVVPPTGLSYRWSLQEVVHDRKRRQGVTLSDVIESATDERSLTLHPGGMLSKATYLFAVEVMDERGRWARTAKVALAPDGRNGTVAINPPNGTAMSTSFVISARGFQPTAPMFNPVSYSFYYVHPTTRRHIPLRVNTPNATIETKLPRLSPSTAKFVSVTIEVHAVNHIGKLSKGMASVKLTQPRATAIITPTGPLLSTAVATGDISAAMTAAWLVASSYAVADKRLVSLTNNIAAHEVIATKLAGMLAGGQRRGGIGASEAAHVLLVLPGVFAASEFLSPRSAFELVDIVRTAVASSDSLDEAVASGAAYALERCAEYAVAEDGLERAQKLAARAAEAGDEDVGVVALLQAHAGARGVALGNNVDDVDAAFKTTKLSALDPFAILSGQPRALAGTYVSTKQLDTLALRGRASGEVGGKAEGSEGIGLVMGELEEMRLLEAEAAAAGKEDTKEALLERVYAATREVAQKLALSLDSGSMRDTRRLDAGRLQLFARRLPLAEVLSDRARVVVDDEALGLRLPSGVFASRAILPTLPELREAGVTAVGVGVVTTLFDAFAVEAAAGGSGLAALAGGSNSSNVSRGGTQQQGVGADSAGSALPAQAGPAAHVTVVALDGSLRGKEIRLLAVAPPVEVRLPIADASVSNDELYAPANASYAAGRTAGCRVREARAAGDVWVNKVPITRDEEGLTVTCPMSQVSTAMLAWDGSQH